MESGLWLTKKRIVSLTHGVVQQWDRPFHRVCSIETPDIRSILQESAGVRESDEITCVLVKYVVIINTYNSLG